MVQKTNIITIDNQHLSLNDIINEERRDRYMTEVFNGVESLRLLDNILNFVDGGLRTVTNKAYDEEDMEYEYKDYILWSKYKCGDNTVIAEYWYLNEGEEKAIMSEDGRCYVAKVFNALIDPYYSHLMDVLNCNSGVTVVVSQVVGTTTDYVIYYDGEIVDIDPEIGHFKYIKCKDGIFERIIL